jgi:hypothetical protein
MAMTAVATCTGAGGIACTCVKARAIDESTVGRALTLPTYANFFRWAHGATSATVVGVVLRVDAGATAVGLTRGTAHPVGTDLV